MLYCIIDITRNIATHAFKYCRVLCLAASLEIGRQKRESINTSSELWLQALHLHLQPRWPSRRVTGCCPQTPAWRWRLSRVGTVRCLVTWVCLVMWPGKYKIVFEWARWQSCVHTYFTQGTWKRNGGFLNAVARTAKRKNLRTESS